MKDGWELKNLGDICDFENGDRGKNYPSKSFRTSQGIAFVNAGHLTSNGIDLINMDYISRERFELLGSGKIRKGDILFCLRGSLGKYCLIDSLSEGAIASSLVIIRNKSTVLNGFLLAYFGSHLCADMIKKYSNGAAQPNLSAGSLKKFKIPVPPLPEQQRIVALLDQAFAAIGTAQKNTERSINNARELFENCLNKTFSNPGKYWERKKIGDISKFEYGKPLSKDKRKANGLYPVYGANGVKARSDEFYYNRKSIIVGRKGSAGEINFTEECFWPLDVTYFVVIDEQKLDLNFFYFLLIFLDLPRLAKGVKPGINRNEIYGLEVFIPPLEEQKLIATKLEKLSSEIENLKMNYQKKLSALNKMKLSILEREISREL